MGIMTIITIALFVLGLILFGASIISENNVLLFIAILLCAVGNLMTIIIKLAIWSILLNIK